MSIITLILTLAIVGVLVWLVLQIPMPAVFQKIIIAVVVVFMVVWILQSFGLVGSVMVPRIK